MYLHATNAENHANYTNITYNIKERTPNTTPKCVNCTTTLTAGNNTPQSQSTGSRSVSQVGSVASSLDLSLECVASNITSSSKQAQPTTSKDKKSKKKKV